MTANPAGSKCALFAQWSGHHASHFAVRYGISGPTGRFFRRISHPGRKPAPSAEGTPFPTPAPSTSPGVEPSGVCPPGVGRAGAAATTAARARAPRVFRAAVVPTTAGISFRTPRAGGAARARARAVAGRARRGGRRRTAGRGARDPRDRAVEDRTPDVGSLRACCPETAAPESQHCNPTKPEPPSSFHSALVPSSCHCPNMPCRHKMVGAPRGWPASRAGHLSRQRPRQLNCWEPRTRSISQSCPQRSAEPAWSCWGP